MSNLVSPNQMLAEAKEQMLDGKEPVTWEDWARIMNFCAANVHPEVAESCCQLLGKIYYMPLSKDHITEIVNFQLERR